MYVRARAHTQASTHKTQIIKIKKIFLKSYYTEDESGKKMIVAYLKWRDINIFRSYSSTIFGILFVYLCSRTRFLQSFFCKLLGFLLSFINVLYLLFSSLKIFTGYCFVKNCRSFFNNVKLKLKPVPITEAHSSLSAPPGKWRYVHSVCW